jgi:hypothetical protein
MGVVETFNRKLRAMEKAINPTIQQTIDQNKGLIIDQQTDGQMYEGKDSNSKDLIPSYALSTKITKQEKGQPTNRVTLKDTGDLYSNIKVDAKTTEMIISANTEYFKYLVIHYPTNQILGLEQSFLNEFVDKKVLPNLAIKWASIIR